MCQLFQPIISASIMLDTGGGEWHVYNFYTSPKFHVFIIGMKWGTNIKIMRIHHHKLIMAIMTSFMYTKFPTISKNNWNVLIKFLHPPFCKIMGMPKLSSSVLDFDEVPTTALTSINRCTWNIHKQQQYKILVTSVRLKSHRPNI